MESWLWHLAVPRYFHLFYLATNVFHVPPPNRAALLSSVLSYLKSITALNSPGGLWSWYVSKKGWRGGGLLINLRLDSNKHGHYLRVCYYIPHIACNAIESDISCVYICKVNCRGSVILRVCVLLSYGKCITLEGHSMSWLNIIPMACTNNISRSWQYWKTSMHPCRMRTDHSSSHLEGGGAHPLGRHPLYTTLPLPNCMLGYTPVNRMTDTCENITFPTTWSVIWIINTTLAV